MTVYFVGYIASQCISVILLKQFNWLNVDARCVAISIPSHDPSIHGPRSPVSGKTSKLVRVNIEYLPGDNLHNISRIKTSANIKLMKHWFLVFSTEIKHFYGPLEQGRLVTNEQPALTTHLVQILAFRVFMVYQIYVLGLSLNCGSWCDPTLTSCCYEGIMGRLK